MPDVTILSRSNGVGLSHSGRLVADVLSSAGLEVAIRDFDDAPTAADRTRAVVFLEQIVDHWIDVADVRLFVPNQEYFAPADVPRLARIDRVLCKTRYAEAVFTALGSATAFVGFTSRDRRVAEIERQHEVLHLAGRSLQKGTRTLVEVWHEHPEWPLLTIVQHPETRLADVERPNVRYVSSYLDDRALRLLQNRHAIHAIPSETEGFGHSIVEAMSCGAAVVTTDGPPMNELITPARGALAAWSRTIAQGVGHRFHVDPGALAAALGSVVGSDQEVRRLGAAARAWYETNDRQFRERLPDVVSPALSHRPV